MRRLVSSLVLLGALALLVPAPASAIIQLDKGIAGVRLNNTKTQVKAALGQPKKIQNGTNPFGSFTRFVYAGRITVLFQGGQRVTSVSTRGLGDRTARGVGVGSTEAAVKNKVAGISCVPGAIRVCHTNSLSAGQRVTAFIIKNGRVTRVDVGLVID